MAKISNLMKGVLVSGLIVGTLAACDDDDTDVTTETTAATTEATTAAPPPPFEPISLSISGSVGFKAPTEEGKLGTVVPWTIEDQEITSGIDIMIRDDRFTSTQNLDFLCALKLVPTETPEADFFDFTFDFNGSGDVDYRHFGYTMKSGSFTVENAPRQVQSGEIGGCLDKKFDTMVWGDDFGALFAAQDWGLYWGDMADEVATTIEDIAQDAPQSELMLLELYDGGYVIGGSYQASEYVKTAPLLYATGFAVDDDMALIPTEDETNPYERLLGSEMMPEDGATPKSGMVQFSSRYVYPPKLLLLGVAQ